MSFKPGDKVRYISEDSNIPRGSVGTVTDGRTSRDATEVSFDLVPSGGYKGWLCCNENLELVEEEVVETILDVAKSLVYGDRNADYGHPYDDYMKNAAFLQTILGGKLKEGETITPQEVILFMITLKVSRLVNDHTKVDSIVDIAGYAECLSRVNRREAGLE